MDPPHQGAPQQHIRKRPSKFIPKTNHLDSIAEGSEEGCK